MELSIMEKIEEVEYSCEIENTYKQLTRATRKTIKEAIMQAGCLDEMAICEKVCDILVDRYTDGDGVLNGGVLEYHTKRMGLSTTGEIRKAISCFLSSPYRLRKLLKEV